MTWQAVAVELFAPLWAAVVLYALVAFVIDQVREAYR